MGTETSFEKPSDQLLAQLSPNRPASTAWTLAENSTGMASGTSTTGEASPPPPLDTATILRETEQLLAEADKKVRETEELRGKLQEAGRNLQAEKEMRAVAREKSDAKVAQLETATAEFKDQLERSEAEVVEVNSKYTLAERVCEGLERAVAAAQRERTEAEDSRLRWEERSLAAEHRLRRAEVVCKDLSWCADRAEQSEYKLQGQVFHLKRQLEATRTAPPRPLAFWQSECAKLRGQLHVATQERDALLDERAAVEPGTKWVGKPLIEESEMRNVVGDKLCAAMAEARGEND